VQFPLYPAFAGERIFTETGRGERMTSYPATPGYNEGTGTAAYAGFWMRFGAALIDGILLGIVAAIIAFIIGMATGNSEAVPNTASFVNFLLGIPYFIMLESGPRQATLGKMALGLKVTGMDGGRISAGEATVRYFSKILSAIILMIGYIMAAFTPKKQALHDIIAKTLVVKA
jgi:uncharacterized RDD family membrane protein YckC